MQPCLVLTDKGGLVARLIKIENANISLYRHSKGKMVLKLVKDLSSARATYEPQVLTECTEKDSGSASEGFMVYPIRIKLPNRQKLTLYFTQQTDRKNCMGRIMQAQGYDHQMDQYQFMYYMGNTTIKAMHKVTGKVVVIKVIYNSDQAQTIDEQLVELTLQSHVQPMKLKGFIQMSEHLVDESFIYLIRHYWNKGNLLHFMRDSKVSQLTEREIGKKAKHIFRALEAIHNVGFVHGDVRPQNIFINHSKSSGDLNCAFGDFERCMPIETTHLQQPYTETDDLRILYLAPEVIRSQELESSPSSDIWSLGVTLYVLATG